jgi:hypothetical protein
MHLKISVYSTGVLPTLVAGFMNGILFLIFLKMVSWDFHLFTGIKTAADIEIYVGSSGALEHEKLFSSTQM